MGKRLHFYCQESIYVAKYKQSKFMFICIRIIFSLEKKTDYSEFP